MNISAAIAIFLASTVAIAVGGKFLSREGDRLADLTGFGEAIVGAIFLGAVTSLSGITTSFTAALEGHPQLSVSNAIGGIAVQTVFLAIADIAYKNANLEHAAASLSNIMQAVLLIFLLAMVLAIFVTPEIHFFGFHPVSPIMVLVYIVGQKLIARSKKMPMWRAVRTKETREDTQNKDNLKRLKLRVVAMWFAGFGFLIAVAGYFVAQSSIVIVAKTGISESVFGAIFTAASSSMTELIVSVAAVRQRALTLAVSNIIGGNTFDVLFIAFSDVAYNEGSIIHTFQDGQLFITFLTIMLTAVLTLGLLDREKKGVGGIGWESMLLIVLFVSGYSILFFI